jgi:Fe-S-cluster containining protein
LFEKISVVVMLGQSINHKSKAWRKSLSCNGGCCENFPLPMSKEMINRRYQNSQDANGTLLEMKMLKEMVIPLQNSAFVAGGKRFFWYTCKHWSKESRKCTIYEKRPSLCRA